MQFSLSALAFLLAASVSATPTPKSESKTVVVSSPSATPVTLKLAATAANTTDSGSVLTSAAYNDFQISSGTAGTAEAEANALFTKIDMTNLAGVSASDLAIIKGINEAAESAETGAFNDAIDAASGDAATALTNGKIKNKVLKLTAEVLAIQVKAAQGGDDSDLASEQKKLATNIATDVKAAGEPSTAVPFDATS